jgi:hypothetical protein
MSRKKNNSVDDGIPDFLRISQEQRKADWKEWIAKHKPAPVIVPKAEPEVRVKQPKQKPAVIGHLEDKDFFYPGSIIRVLLKKNPSSGARGLRVDVVFAHHGKTVQQFLDAGGNPTTLKNCEKAKWITVENK